jgi:hypothetical protein
LATVRLEALRVVQQLDYGSPRVGTGGFVA